MQILCNVNLCIYRNCSVSAPHPHHPLSLSYRGNYEWKLIILRFQKNSFMYLLNPNFMWQLEHHYIVDCSAIFKLYYMLWGLSCYSQHIHRYFHLGILSVIVLLSIKFFVCFLEVIHHMFSGGMALFSQILSTNLFWGQK